MTIKLEEVTTARFRTTTPVWVFEGKAYGDDDKPDGASLLAGVDGEISTEDAEKYGLGGKRRAVEEKAETLAEDKAVDAPAENKARTARSTKRGK